MSQRVVVAFLCLSLSVSSPALAVNGDGSDGGRSSAADHSVCASLHGGAFGLCVAFCIAQKCHLDDSKQSCQVLRRNFRRLTGSPFFPCEVEAPPTDTPTAAPTDTASPTATVTATDTPEPAATDTPEPEATATFTPIFTATATVEPTATETPEPAPTDTMEPEATATFTPIFTATPTNAPEGFAEEITSTGLRFTRRGRVFIAHLTGDEEVPPVDTQAQGQTSFRLAKDGEKLRFKLNVARIEGLTQAHIHCGPAGVNGPVTVFLFGFEPAGVTVNGRLATGRITDAEVIPLSDSAACPGGISDLRDLIARTRAGLTYVNVHTLANPGGEIRGQLKAPGS
jgi:hypothetical protein